MLTIGQIITILAVTIAILIISGKEYGNKEGEKQIQSLVMITLLY